MKKKIYCVGNAHLDPAWMWKWQEGSAEAKATIRSALDRMKEFSEFKFVCSSASVYEWIEEFDPAMFEEIKQRVREGRFVIVGGWYVQPDCNLPSGEGFARQSLYSQRYFFEKFGKTATVGYNVDSFGHNGMMPQILKKSGMNSYFYMRPSPKEMPMDSVAFRWTAPDGSEVTAYRLAACYCFKFSNQSVLEKELAVCEKQAPKDLDCFPFFYGVGNHGGGPTVKNIEMLKEYAEKHPDTEIIFSTAEDFFEHLRTQKGYELPPFSDDLQHHASGCYAAYSPIKTLIRRGETSLLAAEMFAMMNRRLSGRPYPTEKFATAWKNINFIHFHDIAGGCCIKDAYPDAESLGGESLGIAVKIQNNALQTLSWAVDTSDRTKGTPVIFFNPHPFAVESLVQINRQITSVQDSYGNDLIYQYVFSQTHLCKRCCDSLFRVKVPACGYATYYVNRDNYSKLSQEFAPEIGRLRYAFAHIIPCKGETESGYAWMEDEYFRVDIDSDTGVIARLYDKKNGREMLAAPTAEKKRFSVKKRIADYFSCMGAVPTVMDERSHDTWSHGKNYFDKYAGRFTATKVTAVNRGPLRSAIKVAYAYGNSTLVQYFTLENDGMLKVHATVDWHEKQKMLKIAFGLNLTETKALYEMPFGAIERPTNGEEECGHMWIATVGKEGGVAMLNNNKYSFCVKNNIMSLTAVRSPYYGDHGAPFVSPECELTDQGAQSFDYAILPFDGNRSAVTEKARVFNTPLAYVVENNHTGTLKETFEGLNGNIDHVIVTALKRSEDGSGTVLRAYETNGKEAVATFSGPLLPAPLTATFTPYSVNTYYLPDGSSTWKEVLMTEFDK